MPEPRQVIPAIPSDVDGPTVWRALAAAGRLAEAYRGGDPRLGVDPVGLGRLLSDVDSGHGVGVTLSVCVQVATVVPLLGSLADSVTALAATDGGAGSDLTALETTVSLGTEADDVEVTGHKRWITNATHADRFLVLARHRPGRHFTNFTWVLVPASAPGVHVTPADTDLFDGAGIGHVRFDGVRLPRSSVVGRPGRGLVSFAGHIAVERLAGALWAVAMCRRVLADTRTRLVERDLWRLEAVRQRYAESLVRARVLRAMCDALGARAARRDSTAGALLKSATGPTVEHVLAECAHLQGADGFATGGAHGLRAQAAVFAVGGGTTEVVLTTVADAAETVLEELAA